MLDAADEQPSDEEQRAFYDWAQIVSARSTLERAIEQGNPDALRAARELFALTLPRTRVQLPPPTVNRLADGPPPF